MVSPVRLMSMLGGRSQDLTSTGRGTAGDAPTPQDVAGALGMGRLKPGPYYIGRLVYAQDKVVAEQALMVVTAGARRLFERRGWKTEYCRGIAHMVLFELLWPRRCVDCKGEGHYFAMSSIAAGDHRYGRRVMRKHFCHRCRGKGRGILSNREAGRVAGIGRQQFNAVWAPRAHEVRLMVSGWEDDCLRHLARQFRVLDQAS